jgi:hypothetical protein
MRTSTHSRGSIVSCESGASASIAIAEEDKDEHRDAERKGSHRDSPSTQRKQKNADHLPYSAVSAKLPSIYGQHAPVRSSPQTYVTGTTSTPTALSSSSMPRNLLCAAYTTSSFTSNASSSCSLSSTAL